MSSFELENDSFYICTELAPRCYIVQKAIQIDRGQLERMIGDKETKRQQPTEQNNAEAPPPPVLPYWFTQECRRDLLMCSPPLSYTPSPSPVPQAPDLRSQLKFQLEYYFSRENLMQDRYLRCQMDSDQWVAIAIIASFRKIVQLTTDYATILSVLRESTMVEVDAKGERVRPVSRRCTIILREVAEDLADTVEEMLSGGPPYVSLRYGLNNSWYVTYNSEEDTQTAYLHLQNSGVTINGKPVCARIKTGGPPSADIGHQERCASSIPPTAPSPTNDMMSAPSTGSSPQQQPPMPSTPQYSHLYDLGSVLAAYGFVPRATYRPGQTLVHVGNDGASSTCSAPAASVDSIASTMSGAYISTPTTVNAAPIPLYREFIPSSASTSRGGGRGGGGGTGGRPKPSASPREYRNNGPSSSGASSSSNNHYYENGGVAEGRRGRGGRSGGRGGAGGSGRGSFYQTFERRRGDRDGGVSRNPRRTDHRAESETTTTDNSHSSTNGFSWKPHQQQHQQHHHSTQHHPPSFGVSGSGGGSGKGAVMGTVIPPTPTTPIVTAPFIPKGKKMANTVEDGGRKEGDTVATAPLQPQQQQQRQNMQEHHSEEEGWRTASGRRGEDRRRNANTAANNNGTTSFAYFTAAERTGGGGRRGMRNRAAAAGGGGAEGAGSEKTRTNSESATSAMSGPSSSCPSTVYSFEEQSFPVLVEQSAPQPPKPEPKPTFSFIASGRRREKPAEKKSYAQMLKAPNHHNSA